MNIKNNQLNAGFARTDITPQLGVRLGGYGVRERPAEQVFDNLHATTMVFEQDGVAAAVVNLDWLCVEAEFIRRIREDAHARTGIPPANITICATHTHSAPNAGKIWGWGDPEYEYIDSVLPEIARSIEIAHAGLQPVQVGFATTQSLVGINRRGITEKGGVNFVGDPQGSFDPVMTVAYFRDMAGKDVGMLVHYGAHGTAMGNNRTVSRDWCGVMKDRIESQFAAPVAFLNGATGDVGPRTNLLIGGGICAGGGDGIESVREVGYRAATDAIRALLSIREWRMDLQLRVLNEEIFLPHAPLKPLADAERAMAECAPRKDDWGHPMCEYLYNKAVVDAYKKPLLEGREFSQTITTIGPLALVPMPGDTFSGITLRVKAGSPFQYTLCCGHTNGAFSYLAAREARHRGGYEIWAARMRNAYLLADNIDDVLVVENLKLLRNTKQGEK